MPVPALLQIVSIKIGYNINPLADDVEKEKLMFKQFVDYCAELKIGIHLPETNPTDR